MTEPKRPRGRPRQRPLQSEAEPKRRGPKAAPPELRSKRALVSLPPALFDAMVKEAGRRFIDSRWCSKSQLIAQALQDYLGLRGKRDAEFVLLRLGERAGRVLHKHRRDGLFAEVYHVLGDVAKAGGEHWEDADFTPKPDELTRLAAENARLRRWLASVLRVTSEQIDAGLAARPTVAYPDDTRDGTRTMRDAAEDANRNSMGLPKRAEVFMG